MRGEDASSGQGAVWNSTRNKRSIEPKPDAHLAVVAGYARVH